MNEIEFIKRQLEIIEKQQLEAEETYDHKERSKEEIKKILKEGIENEYTLHKIKQLIFEEFRENSFNTIEENYINHKYIKYCLAKWFNQLPAIFDQIKQNDLKPLIEQVIKIKVIQDIPLLFSNSKYFKPILDNVHLLSKNDCDTILIRFKQDITDYLKEKFANAKQYNELYKEIKDELNKFFSIYEIHKYADKDEIISIGYINKFLTGYSSLSDFATEFVDNFRLKNLINSKEITGETSERISESLEKLKHVLTDFKKIRETKLTNSHIEQVTKIIDYSLTSVKFEIKVIETRIILIVKGVYIALSYILSKLEQQLIESKAAEVCLIASEILFIDCDLENNIWHGTNIAIRAKRILVIGTRTIDVSGVDGEPKDKPSKAKNGKPNQTEEDKNGKHGINGTKGESGGNITIIAEIIENGDNWTITSNGGQGGCGQDGGDGANGEDGKDGYGLTLEEFKRDFPPTAKAQGSSATFAKEKICNHIQSIAREVTKNKRWGGLDFTQKCYYVEAVTHQGNQIYFSFYWSLVRLSKESYCLFKGTSGQPGKTGGFGGLGGFAGEPGFAGDIQILTKPDLKTKIKTKAIDGRRSSDGKPGKDGNFGKPGENKPDVGYIDYHWWSEPKYYGPSWLKLVTYNNSASDRIVDAEHEDITQYIAIETRAKPDPPACLSINEQAKQKHQNIKEKKLEATRKHAISNELLAEIYNNHQSQFSMNSIVENLQVNIDLFREELSRIQIEETNIEKENICITKPFISEKHYKLNKLTKISPSKKDIPSNIIPNLVEKLKESCEEESEETAEIIYQINKELIRNKYDYKNTYDIISSIEKILDNSTWEKIKSVIKQDKKNEYANLKSLLIEKLKLSLLEETAQIVDNNKNDDINITDEFIEEETNSDGNSAMHSILGIKNEFGIYECTDCENIRNKIKENIVKTVNDNSDISKSLHQSIINLIKNCKDKQRYPQMQKYVDNFYKSISKKSAENPKLDHINKIFFEQSVLTEYGDYISRNRQPFNQYDIALLTRLYEICLKVHMLSDNDQSVLKLFATYNENEKNVLHVLYICNRFIKLSVRRVENKNMKYAHYTQILNDIDQLKTSDELNKYFDNKNYRFDKNKTIPNETIENDDEAIDEISHYFHDNIRQNIRLALKPISSEFISNCALLKTLKKRFAIENPSIKDDIITLLSMTILNSNINKENLVVYQWIISAYPQNEWINEILLLKCEQFIHEFYKKISDWRLILRQIECKQLITLLITKIDGINPNQEKIDIKSLLLQIKDCNLKDEEFFDVFIHLQLNQWSIKFKHFSFIQSVENAIHQPNSKNESIFNDDFSSMIYYLYTLNSRSELLVNKLLKISKEKQLEMKQFSDIIYNFYCGFWEFDDAMIKKINGTPVNKLENLNAGKSFLTWIMCVLLGEERKLNKLIEIINNDKYTSISKDTLNQSEVFVKNVNKCTSVQINQTSKSIKSLTIEDIEQWTMEFKSRNYEDKFESLHEALSVIERGIQFFFPEIYALRDTQKLTIASFIFNSKNLLAQVSTGEGKSLIVASIMIIKCLLGEKGDIITSSPVLAERDANENEKLFNLFGISVAHNSYENIHQRRTAYDKQIVYGDVSSFQRDYLLDHFYGKKILGDRYEKGRLNIIVDEVDSMLLDKGNCVLYLSHQPPYLDTLESVYIFIWQMVITNAANGKYSSINEIKKVVLHNLYPILDKQELIKLTNNRDIIDKIWDELIDNNNIDINGKILSYKIEFEDENLKSFNKHVQYLLKEISNHEKQLEVPNYLKPFIEQHLTAWIESAIKALEMEEGRNYILDVDKNAIKLDKHPNIIIIDCDTGVDQINSQWNEGLHQFLQLKHQCKTSLLSLKAVFISNISFFKKYTHIYGLSGTLGSENEREFLKTTYDVDFLTVPVALPSKFKEDQPILCKNIQQWREKLVEEAINISKQRSVLIICETVKDVEQINQFFKLKENFNLDNIFVYKRSYEKFSIEHQGLGIGKIIIATNLAGRGTDIKVTNELNNNGGLHVILTYLPENYRIEQQAFGRTARKGQNGSGQLIFVDRFSYDGNELDRYHSSLQVIDLKNERDYNELCRVGGIRRYYETSIQFEEQLFSRYHKAYDRLKEQLERKWKAEEDLKEIIFNSVLNKWAFWLDDIGTMMNNKNNKIQIIESLEKFINQLDNIRNLDDSIKQLVTEPTQLIKLGKWYIKDGQYNRAYEVLDKVIGNEPKFCQAAYYYKAHCIVKKTTLNTSKSEIDFHRSLDYAEILFKHHIDILTRRNAIINQLSKAMDNKSTISYVAIDSYRVQNENICNLYSSFIRSIHDIRGHQVTPDTLSSVDIDQELAFITYKTLLNSNENILIKKQFNKNFSEHDFKMICIEYQLNYDKMKEDLSTTKFLNEEKLKKYLEDIQIPNREHFWQLMIKQGIITNVKHLVMISVKETDDKNAKLKKFIHHLGEKLKPVNEIKPKDKSTIFFEKINFDAENLKYTYESIDEKYQILKEQKLISSNQTAEINSNKLRNIPIGKFESVKSNDFSTIEGLNTNDSQEIYDKLVEQKIIDNTGTLLTINLQKLNLGKYQIYDQRIISIINCQCLYKFQILELIEQIDSEDFDNINLTLPFNLHQELLYDLESASIVKPVYYNFETIDVKLHEKLLFRDYSYKLEQLIQKTCSSEEKISKSVAKSLQSTIGKLNYLSTPNSYLNDIEQNFDGNEKFQHIEELDIFTINGLDHIIDIEESKWTWQMVRSTAVIFVFGFAQIVAGVYLELYSMGIGTHIAAGLISEGISDIFYALAAAKSGHFSWNDYFVHKIKSIMFTLVTIGIAGLISRGIRYSRFGSKLVGNTGNLSKLSGTKLLNAASNPGMAGVKNNIIKKVWCRVGLKLTEGVAFGLSSAGISYISEKLFKDYCGKIVNELFLNIRESIKKRKNKIKESLKKIYQAYGPALTQKWLAEINQSNDTETWYGKVFEWIKKIVNVVSGGISQGLRKMSQANYSSDIVSIAAQLTPILNTVMQGATYVKAIGSICLETKYFLNDKIAKLEEKANKCPKKVESTDENSMNEFIEQTTEQWSKSLETKIDTDVRTKIIEPLLNQGANALLRSLGKDIQKYHQRRKDHILWKKFQENKDKYEEQKKNLMKNQDENSNTSKILQEITNKYNHNILVIMAKTKDPNLVASIVEEGGPMDMVSIHAMANILNRPIKVNNVDGTTFPDLICPEGWDKNNIHDKDCIPIDLVPGDGVNTFGHFLSSEKNNENSMDNNDNNCLIRAIMGIKGDNMSSFDVNNIRKKIAEQIRTNHQIGNIIENGYHRYYISQLGFGGQLPTSVQELKNLALDENFSNEHIIGLVGVHGNGQSYGITCFSKQKVRESEHLIPRALVERLSKVMCIRHLIKTKHPKAVGNELEEKQLFDHYMGSVISKKELDKFMIASEEMLTICIPYSAHHNREKTWTSFRSLYPDQWKEAESYIDAYKSVDVNKNDLLLNSLMKQYEDLLNNQLYPRIRQGFAKYLELSESRGYINSSQRNQLMNTWKLSTITTTDQMNQLPIDHKYYKVYNDVYEKGLSMRSVDNRPKRYTGQLL